MKTQQSAADFLPISRPHVWGDEVEHVVAAIRDGWVSAQSPVVREFEERFAKLARTPHAMAASSGTAALHLAMKALGVRPGDEVIVSDFSMIAPIFAVRYCGARPVPVDVDETWNLDPDRIAEQITPSTRAILVVHTYGHPARLAEIAEVSKAHGLPLVEDVAEALGATIDGHLVGTLGDIACHSFFANKILTTGEGGMVTCANEELAQKIRWYRNMCFGVDDESRFRHEEIGFNYRMSSLQAAFGIGQLSYVEESIRQRIDIAQQYNRHLAHWEGITLPPEATGARNVYWSYGILVDSEKFGVDRRTLQQELRREGIETRRFFEPVHRQPCLDPQSSDRSYPKSEKLAELGLLLPSFVGMSSAEIERVVTAVKTIPSRGKTAK